MRQRDVPGRRIAMVAGAIGLVVVSVVLAVIGLMHAGGLGTSPLVARSPFDALPQSPRLQSAPQLDIRRYRIEKQRELEGTGWVDAAHRVARIPIDDAMAMMVAKSAAAASGARP